MTLDSKLPSAKSNPADLMIGYLTRSVDLAAIEAETAALGEVEPHEVAVGFRADPRLAWREGFAIFDIAGKSEDAKTIAAPAEWSSVVVREEASTSQAFALANYPQRVRDLTALLQSQDLTKLCPTGESRPASAALNSWAARQVADGSFAQKLVAAAVLRSAGDFDRAEPILNELRAHATENELALLANEEAALLWHRGRMDKAVEIWERLPKTPAVLFNCGMANLFLNQPVRARESLKKAVAALPETSGWHHLASMYLALAEIRNG